MRNLLILGSTGSIGRQTLGVVREMRDRIRVYGLIGHVNAEVLRSQAEEFTPTVVLSDASIAPAMVGYAPETVSGQDAIIELCTRPEVDLVVVATSGGVALRPTIAALEAGKLVALANKETLVAGGALIGKAATRGGGQLVPIDSEHSAIWQCLQGEDSREVERLTLTASGGPLRHLTPAELERVTPTQALAHPTWSMGRKITVDSANLMNKGLEVLEAQWLFDVPAERVGVVIHPQSIVHSLVTFSDGSTKAQLGLPNMRLPIQYALSHPDRWPNTLARLDLETVGRLDFAPVEMQRYPALALALEAGRLGGTYPAILSAADEVAVEAFLSEAIAFTRIPEVVAEVMAAHVSCESPTLDHIIEVSSWARSTAWRLVGR